MGQDEEQRGMEIGWVFFIELKLVFQAIPGIVKCMNLIQPEGFLVESVES